MKHGIVACVAACVLACSACAHRTVSNAPSSMPPVSPPRSVAYDGTVASPFSGVRSVRIVGTVIRSETAGDKLEFVVHATLALQADGARFPRGGVHLTRAILTASVIDARRPPSHRRVIHRESRSIALDFFESDAKKTLPEIRFVLLQRIETQADYVTVEVTDGRVTLPLALELKRQFR